MGFDSPDLSLSSILNDIAAAKIQLPDFQREWKWDDDRIRGLLASIGRGHPVGVLMMLEVGGDGAVFAPKPIAGVEHATGTRPEQLLLDGQQRLTSLYQSLQFGRPVDTTDARGKRLRRWYYVDIEKALADPSDLEEAIRSIPEDRVVRDQFGRNVVEDLSSQDAECAAGMFPLRVVFDYSALTEWQMRYVMADEARVADRLARWKEFYETVLRNFVGYTVPAIVLKKDTPKEAVCTVFEKVNTGGVALNVFELLTATYAADNFRLKEDWAGRRQRFLQRPVLRSVENTDYLQAVTLLATRARKQRWESANREGQSPGVGCKRKDMLALSLDDYRTWADAATEGFEWAASFLNKEFVFRSDDVPYRTQIVPLAVVRVLLGRDADNLGITNRLRQWYWSGVLGELYGGTTETRFARDVEQIPGWARSGAGVPNSVGDAVFREQRLLTLHTRNSAAYKGIYALLMRGGSMDWMKHQPMNMATFLDYQVDIHHIFPKAWCAKNSISHQRQESIVNKTAISRSTNIAIGGRAPSEYVQTLESKAGVAAEVIDQILASHQIAPTFMRANDFSAFFEARTEGLLGLVEDAMGKPAIRETPEDPEVFEEPNDEDEQLDVADPIVVMG
jgi:hypothetical protein